MGPFRADIGTTDSSPFGRWTSLMMVIAMLTLAAVACRSQNASEPETLAEAVASGDVVRAMALLEDGADPNAPRVLGLTPLMRAVNRNDAPMVKVLLDAGAEPTMTDVTGMTALHIAAQADAIDAFVVLLETGADPGERSANGMDALAYAASGGAVKIIDALADRGLDLDAPSGVSFRRHGVPRDRGSTPLGVAVRAGQADSVARLLQRGADPNGLSSSGSTPLLEAVYHNAPAEIVSLLLKAGADMEARGRCDSGCSKAVSGPQGLTAVEWAVELDREEILAVLLSQPHRD